MNSYFWILCLSTVCLLFGTGLQKTVQLKCGPEGVSLSFSLFTIFECGIAGGAFMYFLNGGGHMDLLPFTVIMAAASSLISNLYTPLMFKALETAGISAVYLFTTIGCMILPYLFGIVCLGENISLLQFAGLLMLIAAIALPAVADMRAAGTDADRRVSGKFYLYCTLICIVSGISAIINKMYWVIDDYGHNTRQEYIFVAYLVGAVGAVVFAAILLLRKKWKNPFHVRMRPWVLITVYIISGVAGAYSNYLTNTCVAVLPASVVNPLSTGFNLILTTLMARIVFKERLSKVRIISMLAGIAAVAMIS